MQDGYEPGICRVHCIEVKADFDVLNGLIFIKNYIRLPTDYAEMWVMLWARVSARHGLDWL